VLTVGRRLFQAFVGENRPMAPTFWPVGNLNNDRDRASRFSHADGPRNSRQIPDRGAPSNASSVALMCAVQGFRQSATGLNAFGLGAGGTEMGAGPILCIFIFRLRRYLGRRGSFFASACDPTPRSIYLREGCVLLRSWARPQRAV